MSILGLYHSPYKETKLNSSYSSNLVSIGALSSVALVLLSAYTSGSLQAILHFPSMLLVIGGLIAVACTTYSLENIIGCYEEIKLLFLKKSETIQSRKDFLLNLSKNAKKQGLIVLDSYSYEVKDDFLKFALQSTLDSEDSLYLKEILTLELQTSLDSRLKSVDLLQTLASFAPTIGFLGTVIGLIGMLNEFEYGNSIGSAMALALVTSLYGSILSQLILLPLSHRLDSNIRLDHTKKEITVEALIGIKDRINTLLIEQKLLVFGQ
jgi:chemotaxis protein MotA